MADIEVFAYPSPNNFKVLATLEALNVEYKLHKVDILKGEHLQEPLKSINPCEITPAINDDKLNLCESANIMEYLEFKFDKDETLKYPRESPLYWELNQFLFFHATSISVFQDRVFYFIYFNKEATVKAVELLRETIRCKYKKIEQMLAKNGTGYLVGDKLTIADIMAYPHAKVADYHGLDLETLPNFKSWREKMANVSFIQKAYAKMA